MTGSTDEEEEEEEEELVEAMAMRRRLNVPRVSRGEDARLRFFLCVTKVGKKRFLDANRECTQKKKEMNDSCEHTSLDQKKCW